MTPLNFNVIGLQIGELQKGGAESPALSLLDSEKPDLFRVKQNGGGYSVQRGYHQ